MADDPTRLDDILASLRRNPMFALMLSSQELFHSNFLAWLLDEHKNLIGILLGLDRITTNCSVLREKNHTDLKIQDKSTGETVAVIENKLKDVPRSDQLDRYSNKIPPTAKKMILSLIAPEFDVNKLGWEYLSYGELGKRIDGILADLSGDHKIFVQYYSWMIRDLAELMGIIIRRDKSCRRYWFYRGDADGASACDNLDKRLDYLRLLDAVNKRRASELLADLEAGIRNSARLRSLRRVSSNEHFCNGEIVIYSHVSLTNKQPLVSITLNREVESLRLGLGVQVQATQYRRFVEWANFRVKDDKGEKQTRLRNFVDNTDRCEWIFRDENERHVSCSNGHFLGTRKMRTNSKNGYVCSYAPHFVYRYANIYSGKNQTSNEAYVRPDELKDAVIADLTYALERLHDREYWERYRRHPKSVTR